MFAPPTSQPFNLSNTQMLEQQQQQQHHQFGAQRMAGEVSNQQQQQQQRPQQQGGESSVTLLIKHLPDAIPHETVFRLFSHYGATAVRPFSSGRMRNCGFVDFKNEALAYQAQVQLNGFLGKVLSVERASKPNEGNPNKQTEGQKGKENLQSASPSKDVGGTRDVGDGLKSGSVPVSEPIAPRLGVDYLFPPHLEYAYPPPDGNILTNIVNALIAVPRFYTQVLHLMNKMNIPAPFRMALPTPPLPPSTPAPPQPPPPSPPSVAAKHYLEDLSSSESEMESSDMEVDDKANSEVKTSGKKRKRNKASLGRGGIPATLVPKEIPVIKKKNPIFQVKIVSKLVHNEQKDDTLREETEDLNEWGPNHKAYATAEEIESKKLAPEEIFSKFKNYAAGIPAPVLYIKNLAKNVVVDDFFYIFGSLFGSIDAAKTGLGVKLMQEGRMRGQAFLTFPSVELANQALNLANGFVFKEKPMIIQFGRNPSAAKEN